MPSKLTPGPTPADLYVDAKEAAGLLNISLPTLYTYVTRKNVRVHRPPGARASLYLRSDLERLKEGKSQLADRQITPGLATSTAITLLAEGDALYRGRKATDLARSSTLEEVARLLWQTDDFDLFEGPWHRVPSGASALRRALAGLDGPDRLTVMLPVMEAANPRAHDLAKPNFLRSGADLLLQAAAIEIGQERRGSSPVHAFIAGATGGSDALKEAIRTVLVLSADLAMEPATYAVRAAANTGATPYGCVVAGLAAASGKRLPSARVASFARFISEIEAARDPREPVASRVRESEALPGFGFSPLATTDARSACLWSTLQRLLDRDRRFERFDTALRLGRDLTGLQPDFALLAAYVSHRLECKARPNLVQIGRLVGWIAHALEQQTESPLIRWRVNYKGPLPE